MFVYPKSYDVLVIGGGHAGVEAALAASRLGVQVCLLSQNLDSLGQMSCNPAIGGLGKGHMVREIDALGGIMAENTDATAIQWRMLNASKGPSVRAPRAQCDKKAYQFRIKAILEADPNIDLHQANVAEILTDDNGVSGITTSLQVQFYAKTIILSAGTFMRGLMHVGLRNEKGGRMGDGISTVSDSLKQLGFAVDRFKTGTPCRINGNSIDFDRCEEQSGDVEPTFFSYHTHRLKRARDEIFTLNPFADEKFHVEQLPCWSTYTNSATHTVIRDNIDQSPMYAGVIEGVGPRYCPSIEDKVMRFAEKERHQVFLEPEGRHTSEYYVNGVSTSLPMAVQYDFIRSIVGLENASIIRPGYAVEYDYCPPTQLKHTLETKLVPSLYFAGQINGTSGYEEAAGQGLVAGANAALKAQNKPEFVLARHEAYIGVMIDDLVTKGCTEPYRMFTSRAEYRLLLRQDNADERLSSRAASIGLLTTDHLVLHQEKMAALEQGRTLVREQAYEGVKLDKWFRRPSNHFEQLPAEIRSKCSDKIWELLEVDFRHAGHIARQQIAVDKMSRREHQVIPAWFDFAALQGLKSEAKARFSELRPSTIGQAGRIPGVTPADVALLAVNLEKALRSRT